METIDDFSGGTERGAPMHRSRWTDYDNPTTAVVEAVSDATGVNETDLATLHEWVDTDALDAILTHGSSDGVTVSFEYDGVVVRITSAGTIEVWRT